MIDKKVGNKSFQPDKLGRHLACMRKPRARTALAAEFERLNGCFPG